MFLVGLAYRVRRVADRFAWSHTEHGSRNASTLTQFIEQSLRGTLVCPTAVGRRRIRPYRLVNDLSGFTQVNEQRRFHTAPTSRVTGRSNSRISTRVQTECCDSHPRCAVKYGQHRFPQRGHKAATWIPIESAPRPHHIARPSASAACIRELNQD